MKILILCSRLKIEVEQVEVRAVRTSTVGSLFFSWGLGLETSHWEMLELCLYNGLECHLASITENNVSQRTTASIKECFVADWGNTIHWCQMTTSVKEGMEDRNYAIEKGYEKKIMIFKENPNSIDWLV